MYPLPWMTNYWQNILHNFVCAIKIQNTDHSSVHSIKYVNESNLYLITSELFHSFHTCACVCVSVCGFLFCFSGGRNGRVSSCKSLITINWEGIRGTFYLIWQWDILHRLTLFEPNRFSLPKECFCGELLLRNSYKMKL